MYVDLKCHYGALAVIIGLSAEMSVERAALGWQSQFGVSGVALAGVEVVRWQLWVLGIQLWGRSCVGDRFDGCRWSIF